MRQKGFSAILILVGIFLAVIIVGSAFYFGKSQSVKPATQNPVITPQALQPTSIPSPSFNSSLREYTNNQYKFTFSYPEDWDSQIPEVSTNNFRLDFLKFDQDYNDFERPDIILIINRDDKIGISSQLSKEYNSKGNAENIGILSGDFYQGVIESRDYAGKTTFQHYKADYLVSKENVNYWFRLSTKPEFQSKHLEDFKKIIFTFKFN